MYEIVRHMSVTGRDPHRNVAADIAGPVADESDCVLPVVEPPEHHLHGLHRNMFRKGPAIELTGQAHGAVYFASALRVAGSGL